MKEFIAAIVEQPDNDAIRLICADWLEEHNDHDRAEFIRIQCEIARASKEQSDYFNVEKHEQWAVKLVSRSDELIKLHQKEWAGKYWQMVRFYRGFPETLRINFKDAIVHDDCLVETLPTVRNLEMLTYPTLNTFTTDGVVINETCERFVQTKLLKQVKSLNFEDCELTRTQVRTLFCTDATNHIEDLIMGYSNSDLMWFLRNAMVKSLKFLNIESIFVQDSFWTLFLQVWEERFPNLRTVIANNISDEVRTLYGGVFDNTKLLVIPK